MFAPRLFQRLIINRLNHRTLFAALFLLLPFFPHAATDAQAQQAAKNLRLGKVEVVGLEHYTQEQVVTASGLQIGQPIDIPAADEAANKLMSSGFFKTLSYRFR
jgi:outer membrane protein assembly factor BamA